MQIKRPHVALLASPGMGHLIPVLELAKQLITYHDLIATIFVVTTDASASQSLLKQISSVDRNLLNVVLLPFVDMSVIKSDSNKPILLQIAMIMHHALPSLRSAIASIETTPVALMVDLFGTEAMSIADEFGMFKYVFMTTHAHYLAVRMYMPTLDNEAIDTMVKNEEPWQIPGCKPVRFHEPFGPDFDRSSLKFENYMQVGIEIAKADGMLVNTWHDMEPETFEAFRDENKLGRIVQAKVYPVGPLVRPANSGFINKVLEWLDEQPVESVIFVSFGSGGTLSLDQTRELAFGLEQSEQRFIWVFRPPIEDNAAAAIFKQQNESLNGSNHYLPIGFLGRTQNKGLMVPNWAPQAEILAHPSIGGFLTHVGWNSTLESIINGVPMIAWPLYSEQRMNASILEDLGVAIRAKAEAVPPSSVVGREEIERMVRCVMVNKEGHKIRRRVQQLKLSAQKALSQGGSSYTSLSIVATNCKDKFHSKQLKLKI